MKGKPIRPLLGVQRKSVDRRQSARFPAISCIALQRRREVNDLPSFDLTGKVALVTGAARGLGNAISLALADAGADLALGLRDVSTGDKLADSIRANAAQRIPAANGSAR